MRFPHWDCSLKVARFRIIQSNSSCSTRACLQTRPSIIRVGALTRYKDSMSHILQIYGPQMLKKIHSSGVFPYVTESAEDIAHMVFVQFYIHLCREQFSNFATVPRILEYWHSCVWTELQKAATPSRFVSV